MTFDEMIKKNPMVNTSRAIPILTHLTLTQFGVLSSENLNNAYLRTSKYITDLILSSDTVTKQFFIANPNDQFADDIEVDYTFYCEVPDNKYIMVNFSELLKAYNYCRSQDDFAPKHISLDSHSVDAGGPSISPSVLVDFATSICRIVTNIAPRDDLMKAETLEAIIDEGLNKITDEAIKAALPKIKTELRNIFADKITKGRLSNVVDKKIKSAIHLADTYKDAASDADKFKRYQKEIAGFDLSVADRNHIVDVFNQYRNTTR